ncbi:MAG: PDZ domain-containing protein [Gemmatimonadales bacterium]
MIRGTLIVAFFSLASIASAQQKSIEYEIAFPNKAEHVAQVTATFRGVPRGSTLEARMARSSPGRYALSTFSKNVYDVAATDSRGRALRITRPDLSGWNISGHDGTVKLTYNIWGDRTDGTYLQVDHAHAHMNIPATFMFARGMSTVPIRLKIAAPAGWRVATQLVPTSDPFVFTAPNMQWFMDSPTEVGPVMFSSWDATHNGKKQTWRIAVHHLGTQAQVDSFATMSRKIVEEEIAIFGEPPTFDYGTYTFISDYLPWVNGDGMEHRNSTILSGRGTLQDSAARAARLGSLSHEFFHSWNMERLRSKALEPFDFDKENVSRELWLGEGFDNYYGPLAIRRAGFYSDDDFAGQIGGALIGTINSPGRQHHSATDMSALAPFYDGASFLDPNNVQDVFLSYYTWGSVIGLSLDLILRTKYNSTLDEYMRALWRDYGSHQTAALAPARPYTNADVRNELANLTKDSAFANDFFRRYVEGREVPDLTSMLARAGFLLAADSVVKPYFGASLDNDPNAVFVNWSSANGSAYASGLSSGDLIHSIDGKAVNNKDSLTAIVVSHKVGDVVQLEVTQREQKRTIPMKLIGIPSRQLTTYEKAGLPVTAEMRAFRESWLGSKITSRGGTQ